MSRPRYVTNLPDNKNEPFGGAFSVYDDDTVLTRNQAIEEYAKRPKFFDYDQVRLSLIHI